MKLIMIFLLLFVTTFALIISMDMLELGVSLQEALTHLWETIGSEKPMVIVGFLITIGYILITGLRQKMK